MQSHKDIARASSRANRLETSLAWAGLSQALNAVGPPCKSDEDWRRVSDVTAMTNTRFLRSCSPTGLEGLEVHNQEEDGR